MNNALALKKKAEKKGIPLDGKAYNRALDEDHFVRTTLRLADDIPTLIPWEPSYDGMTVWFAFFPFAVNFPFHYVIKVTMVNERFDHEFFFSWDLDNTPLGDGHSFPTLREAMKFADIYYDQSRTAGSATPERRKYLP